MQLVGRTGFGNCGGIGLYLLNSEMLDVVKRLEAAAVSLSRVDRQKIQPDEKKSIEAKLGLEWACGTSVIFVNGTAYEGVGRAEGTSHTVKFSLGDDIDTDLVIYRPTVGTPTNSRFMSLDLRRGSHPICKDPFSEATQIVYDAGRLIERTTPNHRLAQLVGLRPIHFKNADSSDPYTGVRMYGIAEVHLAQDVLRAYDIAQKLQGEHGREDNLARLLAQRLVE